MHGMDKIKLTPDGLFKLLGCVEQWGSAFSWIALYSIQHEREKSDFLTWSNREEIRERLLKLRRSMNALRGMHLKMSVIREFITYWIELARADLENLSHFCQMTVIELDLMSIPDSRGEYGKCEVGPLNDINDGSNLLIVPRFMDALQTQYLKTKKVRPGRNTISFWPDRYVDKLNHLIFLPVSQAVSEPICVTRYLSAALEAHRDVGLRISIAPIGRDYWFKWFPNQEEKTFSIGYPYREVNEKINRQVCAIIQSESQRGADVVVFPEMAMNDGTEMQVRKFLTDHPRIKDATSLIFLGTFWNNHSNEGCVLSGSGTPLFSYQKHTRHEQYDEGIYYTENLLNIREKLHMLDIPGIGRMSWQICRDFINGSLNNVYRALGVTMQIASCWASSLELMCGQAESAARENAIISVVVNHCIPEKDGKMNHGFVCTPVADERRRLSPNTVGFTTDAGCAAVSCQCSGCLESCTIGCDMNVDLDVQLCETI